MKLLFSVVNVMARETIEKITTLLDDTFINLLVVEVNNLMIKGIKNILIDEIDKDLPESRSYFSRKLLNKSLKHFVSKIIARLSEIKHDFIGGNSNN